MSSEPIAGHVVARHLRVHSRTLDDWHKAGFLSSASTSRRCYYEADLDSFLAGNARNFDKTPSFADLVTERIRLLTLEEAADILKLGGRYIATLVTRGHLPAIKYMHELRYCRTSVMRHAAARNELTPSQVAHVLGFASMRSIPSSVQDKLEKKLKGRYSRESVLALLEGLMPSHQSPEEWLEDRLISNRPLLSISRAVPSQDDRRRIRELLNAGSLHYINLASTPDGDRRLISPDSLLAHLERTEQPYTKEQLAHLFGVKLMSIYNWDNRYKGWRHCSVHGHYDDSLYRDCIIFILQKYVIPGTSAVAWHNACHKSEEPPIATAEAAELLGVSSSKVWSMAQSRLLSALQTPGGDLRYLRPNVVSVKKNAIPKRKAARSD